MTLDVGTRFRKDSLWPIVIGMNAKCSPILVAALVLSSFACKGELGADLDASAPTDDGGSSEIGPPGDDLGMDVGQPDMPMPMVDPLCTGITCTPNSQCHGGVCYCSPGFMGDPATGCTVGNPCDGVDCPFGATCRDDGLCSCDAGFEDDALGGCVYIDPGFPEERTQQEVCTRWATDYPRAAVIPWQTTPADTCDPGELDPEFQLDGIRRVSLFRWLAGLPAVTSHPRYAEQTQACATALSAEGIGIRPTIESSFTCYSGDAAEGASSSNIARGLDNAADAVDYFLVDADADTLGRRRWLLNPEMGATAFGVRGEYVCMYAVDDSGSANPTWVAYPVGTFPQAALLGPWTFSSQQLDLSEATVTITDGNGAEVSVTNLREVAGMFGLPTIAWEVAGATAPATYTVNVTNLSGVETEVTYTVGLVACP